MTLLVTESRQNLPTGRILVQVVCTRGCGVLHVTAADDSRLAFVLRRLSGAHDRLVHPVPEYSMPPATTRELDALADRIAVGS